VSWGEIFDLTSLTGRPANATGLQVLEFTDYAAVWQNKVDLAVAYHAELGAGRTFNARPELADEPATSAGKRGEFEGLVAMDVCKAGRRPVPEAEPLGGGAALVDYSGYCDGGIEAKLYTCAKLATPFPTAVVDFLVDTALGPTRSVLLKHYDYLLAPDGAEMDRMALRSAMVFKRSAVDAALRRAETLGAPISNVDGQEVGMLDTVPVAGSTAPRAYIAVHMRRGDFVKVRTKTTPDIKEAAAQIAHIVEETTFNGQRPAVGYVSTDAREQEKTELQAAMKNGHSIAVHYGERSTRKGVAQGVRITEDIAYDILMCAFAGKFVGTSESRFSGAIQLERRLRGHAKHASMSELCKEAGSKCEAPAYRWT